MNLRFALLCAAIASAGAPALAQHGHHGSAPGASAYAGQQSRDIKALSEKEVKDLLEGAGMGFAKAAELNRHPGPMHALEHAAAIGEATARLRGEHLKTHLETRALLSPAQVDRYVRERGY